MKRSVTPVFSSLIGQHKRLITCLSALVCAWCIATGAETIIVGEVVSAGTGEPIANASVYFAGTKIGTASDSTGSFFLHVDLRAPMKLKFSAVGYKSQRLEIQPGGSKGMQVVLEERSTELAELFVVPGANPALPLLDSVRAHKPVPLKKAGSHEEVARSYYLSGFTKRHLERRLWRSAAAWMVQESDSTLVMPIPKDLAEQYALLEMPPHLDVYRSLMPFGSLSFLSPLAGSGTAYYQYFLVDSTGSGAAKSYRIRFRPRNSFDPLLTGELRIDSGTWVLSDVTCRLSPKASVNYLSDVQYHAHYQHGRITKDTMSAVLDITSRRDSLRPFPTLLIRQSSESGLPVEAEEPALTRTERGADTSGVAGAMPESPLFRCARWLGYTVHTGYMPTGSFLDIGHIEELLHLNRYETVAFGLPFRTNARLSPRVSLEGYVAYGVRDRGVKYKAGVQWLLPTPRRHLLGAQVWDRYVYVGSDRAGRAQRENSIGYNNLSFNSYVFGEVVYPGIGYVAPVRRRQDATVWWEADWVGASGARPLVETELALSASRIGLSDPLQTAYADTRFFRSMGLSGTVRLGWGQRTADLFVTRKHGMTHWPVVQIVAEAGSWSLETSEGQAPRTVTSPGYGMYGSLHLLVHQHVNLGMGGQLDWLVRAGASFGRMPTALLTVFGGNSSVTYDPLAFNLLPARTYAADRYIMVHADWNGRGILFNRIPGVRYLRLRELLEVKFAYGGLRDSHYVLSPIDTYRSLDIPYVEAGVGIGNILRIADLYAVFRLTDVHNPQVPWWGIRFRLHLSM
ncbi:MAG: carboxypeptidase-like regulatory domain-containing protein [Paludibacteraceae bacterium]|nr:carboxypeptidase-like regulatory domain-containing protein [Paludibacteraceae bacterium]